MRLIRLAVFTAVVAPALGAQGAAPQAGTTAMTRAATAADSALLRALELPKLMERARRAGAADTTIAEMIDIIRRRGLPAEEAVPAVEMEVETLEQGGSKDNFGGFVKAQVQSGLRGRDLAAAIRAERARRGMGPKDGRGNGNARGQGGPPEGRGRPDGAASRPGGRPDGAGRPSGSERSKPSDDSTRGKAPAPRTRRP